MIRPNVERARTRADDRSRSGTDSEGRAVIVPVNVPVIVPVDQTDARRVGVARRQLHFKSVTIVALVAASYWSLVVAPSSVMGKIGSAIVLVAALTAAATGVFHDGNHASYSKSRQVNLLAGYSGDLLGGSSWIWRFKHNNLHHGNTNVAGFDADIDQAPGVRRSALRLSPRVALATRRPA